METPKKNQLDQWRDDLKKDESASDKSKRQYPREDQQWPDQEPADIDKDKAQAHMKKAIKEYQDMPNIMHDPSGTLSGQIVDAKYGEEAHQAIKKFRVTFDSFYLTAKALNQFDELKSRELSLAVTAFQQARQFCGKMLQERGAAKPYTSDKTEQVDKGEMIAEVADNNNITILRIFRDIVEEAIISFSVWCEAAYTSSFIESVARGQAMANLLQGKMWLGELLAIISAKK